MLNVERLVFPEFSIAPNNTTVLERNSAILNCHASGVPKPKLKWTMVGSNGLPTGSVQLSNDSLVIPDVRNTPEYEGMYNCTAFSRAGIRIAQAWLTVWGKDHSVKGIISLVYLTYFVVKICSQHSCHYHLIRSAITVWIK